MTKLERIRSAMSNRGIEAFIVYNEINQHYLSDFEFQDGFLLVTLKNAYLVTDRRYDERASKEASLDFTVVVPEDRKDFITSTLKNDNCKYVGFEADTVSHSAFLRMCNSYPDFTFVDFSGEVEKMRIVKTPDEIMKMQKAQDITDRAFTDLLKIIRPDMTEIEVAAELEYSMRKNGASGLAFETIAVSGINSTHPHGVPGSNKLGKGFLTLDYGAKYQGYCSDMTRTIFIGKADDTLRDVYNTVLKAQLSAIDFLKAGADAGEADKIARDIINVNYYNAFSHSLGHGIGLLVHEDPRVSFKSFGTTLVSGNVVSVEPGIYVYGKYGCRIEDMVQIVEGGVYNFTHSTKELIEIY